MRAIETFAVEIKYGKEKGKSKWGVGTALSQLGQNIPAT